MVFQSTSRLKLSTTILFGLILLLALFLRFYRIDAQSLWNDEGTSVAIAQRDLATIARDAAQDIHPPLYYWLLHGWVQLFGTGEAGIRSLSALLGVGLVALTYALGRSLAGRWAGLAAATLAAINPFQVYYSQEARMYMLLAVLTAGAVLATIWLVERPSIPTFVALTLLEAAGLYTHYSFVFVVAVLNLAYGLWLILTWRQGKGVGRALGWLLSQLAVIALYLPWLPNAIRQVALWPSPAQPTAFFPALANTWRWLVFGPTIETAAIALPLIVTALLAVYGAWSLGVGRRGSAPPQSRWRAALLVLWVGLPLLFMFALGLYREAYLKFLLVTAPAVSLLLVLGLPIPAPSQSQAKRVTLTLACVGAALLVLLPTAAALQNYYAEPAYARDDYRSIAAYIEAVGRPGDAVLLNAPGQQEVFDYYYGGDLPVYPLPESRPLDPAATEAAMGAMTRPGGRVFAVLWATDESDPQSFIEGWLDVHAYQAFDAWYGNVRLAVYAVPERTPDFPDHRLGVRLQNRETGDEITLLGYSLLGGPWAAGDIAQVTLFWQAETPPSRRYKVFLHALDGANHIVGQRDAEPVNGAQPTTLWQPGAVVVDNHGLPIHPATPPDEYRVEVGMYDAETGQRLVTETGEGQVWLEPLAVERPSMPAPPAALNIQQTVDAGFGELALLGYDAYRLGFSHLPDAPLRPGDVLHVALYWRAEAQPSGDWGLVLRLLDSGGRVRSEVAGQPVGGYPTSLWQVGDVWRGQFDLPIPGDAPPGRYRLEVQLGAPDGTYPEPFESEPLTVAP